MSQQTRATAIKVTSDIMYVTSDRITYDANSELT